MTSVQIYLENSKLGDEYAAIAYQFKYAKYDKGLLIHMQ